MYKSEYLYNLLKNTYGSNGADLFNKNKYFLEPTETNAFKQIYKLNGYVEPQLNS
jgi:hypothetical protein